MTKSKITCPRCCGRGKIIAKHNPSQRRVWKKCPRCNGSLSVSASGPLPEPKCLGRVGTAPTGCPIFAVRRTDGQIVPVVIPGRDEEETL